MRQHVTDHKFGSVWVEDGETEPWIVWTDRKGEHRFWASEVSLSKMLGTYSIEGVSKGGTGKIGPVQLRLPTDPKALQQMGEHYQLFGAKQRRTQESLEEDRKRRQAILDSQAADAPAVVPTRRTEVKVKTYASPRDYEHDAPKMAREGWVPEGQVASRGRVSLTRTMLKSPVGIGITGLGRKGEKITVTWVRTR